MSDDFNLSAEELKQRTQSGSRLEDSSDDASAVDLAASIESALRAIDQGEKHKNLSVRDDDLAAMMLGLEEHPERLTSTGQNLARSLDRDPADHYDRSEVLRLALRVGLREADPDVVDEAREAKKEIAADEL